MQKVDTCLIQDIVWIWEDLGRYIHKAKGTTEGMMRKGGVESSYRLQEIPEELQRTPESSGKLLELRIDVPRKRRRGWNSRLGVGILITLVQHIYCDSRTSARFGCTTEGT